MTATTRRATPTITASPVYGPPGYAPPAYASNDAEAYCASRFRSYNPVTQSYTGYDGLQHPCP